MTEQPQQPQPQQPQQVPQQATPQQPQPQQQQYPQQPQQAVPQQATPQQPQPQQYPQPPQQSQQQFQQPGQYPPPSGQYPQQPGQYPQQQYPAQYPPQQAPLPQSQSTETKKHVHHTYIWAGGIQAGLLIAFVFAITFVPIILAEELPGWGGILIAVVIIVFTLLIVGLIVGIQAISYRHLYYEIGASEFSLYSGIFNKKQVHVPYQRVQSVNQKASILQRILGVCTVNIDTAGGASNKAVVIPYIRNTEAEYLRTELFERKRLAINNAAQQGAQSGTGGVQASQKGSNVLDGPAEIMSDVRGVFGGSQVFTGQVSYEYGLSNKELIFTGLSNNTGFVLLVLTLVGTVFGVVSQFISTNVGQRVYSEGVNYATRLFSDNLVWFIVATVLIVMVVAWLFSIIATCISYGGFKASRRDTRIEIQHGLLQHQFHGVDIDRVQSVIIKQSFIRRLIGYCEISLGKIDAVTENSQEQENNIQINRGMIIHPFVKMNQVPEILAGLVPEFSDVPAESVPLPKVALRRAVVRRAVLLGSGFWLAVMALIVQLICNFIPAVAQSIGSAQLAQINLVIYVLYVLCLLIAIIEVINAVMWYRGSSFAYNKTFMQVSNGGFSRESVTFPRKKIQFGHTRTNPFQRLSHVATINARSAAGIGGTTTKLLDVHEEDAEKWMEWLRPGKNMVR